MPSFIDDPILEILTPYKTLSILQYFILFLPSAFSLQADSLYPLKSKEAVLIYSVHFFNLPRQDPKKLQPDQQAIIMRGRKRKHPNSIFYVEICNPNGSTTTEVQVEYEIKAIVGHRFLKQGVKLSSSQSEHHQDEFKKVPLDQIQFLVKWVGEPEPTWEPGQNLKNAPLLLQAYKKKIELEQVMSATKPTPKTRGRKPKNPSNPAKPKGPRSKNFNFNRVYTEQNDPLKSEEEDELLIIDKETYIKGTKQLPEDEPNYLQRDEWKLTPPRETNKKDIIKDNQDQSFQRDAYYDESPQEKSERHKSKRETLGEKIERKQRYGRNNQIPNIAETLSMNIPDMHQRKNDHKQKMRDFCFPIVQKKSIQGNESENILDEAPPITRNQLITHQNHFEVFQNKIVQQSKKNQIFGQDLLSLSKSSKEPFHDHILDDHQQNKGLFFNPSDQLIDKFMNERVDNLNRQNQSPQECKPCELYDQSMCLEDYLNLPALLEENKLNQVRQPKKIIEQVIHIPNIVSNDDEIIVRPEEQSMNKRKCPSEYNEQDTIDKTSKKQKLNDMSPFLKEKKPILMIDLDDSEEIKAVIARENTDPQTLKERIHNQVQNLLAHDHFNEQSLLQQSQRQKLASIITPLPSRIVPPLAIEQPLPTITVGAFPSPIIPAPPFPPQQTNQSEYRCETCIKHQQHNQGLRQLYNQLLHSNELNLDNIFLQQQVLSVLSTLNPNSTLSQRFIRKEKMSDVSSNSVLNTLLLRKLSGIEQLPSITKDFQMEKLVKIGQLWVAIYQIKSQRRGTRREHFKYVPASSLIQHSRSTIVSFLIK